ncbi:hypothetical protein SYNGFB01_12105 [Synechococcus sp. GFB01]|nr:hypothetical protein SYNGFB01_12105 [Synechococcus sp. GFB01]
MVAKPSMRAAAGLLSRPALLLSAAAAYSTVIASRCSIASLSCIDPYWIEHWLVGYGGGVVRRGLLGWLHLQLAGAEVNLLALNLFSFGVLLGLLLLLHRALRAMLGPTSALAFWLFALLTPLVGVLLETLGDRCSCCCCSSPSWPSPCPLSCPPPGGLPALCC